MPDMLTEVLAHFTNLADDELKSDIDAMSSYGADTAAKAISQCRTKLHDTIKSVREQYEWLTVDEYADLHHLSPARVKRWIRDNILAAEQTAKGYRIRRTAIAAPYRLH